jgi:malonyl-CoA/methylmalonyl-CoA synthetase
MSSLGRAIADTAARRGSATALLCDSTALCYRELAERANGVSRALQANGVRPGDRVAVGLVNSLELVLNVLGVVRLGAVLVPLNPAYSAEEAGYIVGDSGARFARVDRPLAGGLRAIPNVSVWEDGLPFGVAKPRAPTWPEVPGTAPALIVYTSGTTGRPKGAVLSNDALLQNLTTVARAWRWAESDRLLLTLPCFHLHGLGLGLLASFLVGSCVVLRRRFVAEETLLDLQRTKATMFFGVPTMYNRLVALAEERIRGADLSGMRLWVCGSAPLSAATFERFRDRFGAEILERFGMSECGFVLAAPYEGPRRPGVVGRPLPGVDMRLVDAEKADEGILSAPAPEEAGEIVLRGPNLFSGYWNRPQETRRAFLEGYFRTGDLALRGNDGMYRIVGRRSVDIIKTRGFKVSAVEIEDCLQRHPSVQEVAVVGLEDADQGERVVAAVTPVAGVEVAGEELREYAAAHLAAYKVPAEFLFLAEIPQTGPGKFKKKDLVRLLDAGARDA